MIKVIEDNYTDEKYVELETQAKKILSAVDTSKPEIEKFLTIYHILGKSIFYDSYWDINNNYRASVWDGNQNLERSVT